MKACLFPGQGSQFVGMGEGLFARYPEMTAAAAAILGYPVAELCREDQERRLHQTRYTQPALYVVNGGNDHAESADVGGVLNVPFLGVGQPHHGDRAGVRAGGDHRLDVLELERAVLHLEPGVVVVPGRFAMAGDIEFVGNGSAGIRKPAPQGQTDLGTQLREFGLQFFNAIFQTRSPARGSFVAAFIGALGIERLRAF